ncbi:MULTISPECIES: hypothetical protein [Shewanella]|uniref:hypothetical protein n=1 Tax=Shewanella TaxID=22 RepID=UPI001C65ADB0|nr:MULTISPECIES: hypothetical protein [Shewanella]QYJ74259.1 hypothetical protein K0H79_12850 [Shewanella sp. FJAT-52076]QYK04129.1 hypothetical protein K0H63_13685 [Shewanella zhangzhouensis]
MKALLVLTAIALLGGCAELKDAGRTVGHTTKEVTRDIGHATRDATKAVGHASRDAVNSVKEELSEEKN